MPQSTLTSKGQVTVPKKIRDLLRLRTGDRLDFVIRPNGEVVLKPATIPVSELEGILHRKGMKSVSIEDMNAAIMRKFRKK